MACLSSTILYGETGDGKTGQIGSLAKWVKFRTGKRLRLYTAEPDTGTIDHLIGEFIDVAYVKDRPNASETIALAANGWWPHPSTGVWAPPTPVVWVEIGAIAHDGATEYGNAILEELRIKGAAGEITSAEKAPAQYVSGQMRIAGNNQTHYGIAQGRLKEAINASQKLPVHMLWTARILKVADKDQESAGFSKQFTYGPLLAGKAATADVPSWFGNCIHIDSHEVTDPKTKLVRLERRAYLRKHFDVGSDTPYPAKLRIPPEFDHEMEASLILTPDLLTMVHLFDKIEELRGRARENALAQQQKEKKENGS